MVGGVAEIRPGDDLGDFAVERYWAVAERPHFEALLGYEMCHWTSRFPRCVLK